MLRQAKWMYIICSMLICVLGIVLIAVPSISARVICWLIGILLIVFGACKILGYFTTDMYHLAFQLDLALGAFLVIIGVLFIVRPGKAADSIAVLVGIFTLIDGAFKVQTSRDARKFGLSWWWLILTGALLSFAAGVILVFGIVDGGAFLITMIGIALVIDGIQNLFNAFYTIKVIKNLKKERIVSVIDLDDDDFDVK